jgi:hypothetical protein
MPAPLNPEIVRVLALRLPGAVEQEHHGIPSFRVRGRIFATLPSSSHVHIMLDEDDIRAEVRAHPDCCEGQMWGRKLAALRVLLAAAAKEDLEQWLTDAWEQRGHA